MPKAKPNLCTLPPGTGIKCWMHASNPQLEVFEYGPGTDYQSLMYLKSRYMAADQEGCEQQVAFDRWLMSLGCFDFCLSENLSDPSQTLPETVQSE
jgi:hypothetical protein